MPLNNVKIKNLGCGKHPDGGGLYFKRRDGSQDKWLIRFTDQKTGKRPEMVIGSFPDMSLAGARAEAIRLHELAATGTDPRLERQRAVVQQRVECRTLNDVAPVAFEAHKASLHKDGVAGRWYQPVRDYVLPVLGDFAVTDIDQFAIRDCFQPIWHKKAETAKKAISRLHIILRYAAAEGTDVNLNAIPLAKVLLGKQRRTVEHVASMPWQDMAEFYQALGDTPSELGLRWLILSCTRASSSYLARWEEIKGDEWHIPAEKMKVKDRGDHVVPITAEMQAVLDAARQHDNGNGFIFPSANGWKKPHLSENAFLSVMRRMKADGTPHGCRSTFKNWVIENDVCSERICEMILHHQMGDKVSEAYVRGTFLEKRRLVHVAWSDFLRPSGAPALTVVAA